MGLLKVVAALTLGAEAVGVALVSCQAVIPPGQFFSAQGITAVVSYANSAPPTLLTGAGGYVFYVEGESLYRFAITAPTNPIKVPVTLPGPVTSMVYDGQGTLAYCAQGVLAGLDATTLTPVTIPQLDAGGCLGLALTPTRVAYVAATDAGDLSAITVSRADASSIRESLRNDAGADPGRVAVAIVGETAFYVLGQSMDALGRYTYRAVDADRGQVKMIRTPCHVAYVDPAANPKVVVLDAGGPGSMVLRANSSDTLKRVDLESADAAGYCCEEGTTAVIGPCIHYPLPEQAPGGQGDFTASDGRFYYSDDGLVSRVPLTAASPDGAITDAAPFVDIPGGAPIPSLVVAGSQVFFILGNSIFSAPLPDD